VLNQPAQAVDFVLVFKFPEVRMPPHASDSDVTQKYYG